MNECSRVLRGSDVSKNDVTALLTVQADTLLEAASRSLLITGSCQSCDDGLPVNTERSDYTFKPCRDTRKMF